ncbi:RHS repeat-associated core domain-containing protein [Pseudodesulfovibrio cashew]|uniref:RHS repeat-associated core domain-containing protein n=1 Tax=Pseudodesulfovibrio cashew TaxID=2678688 RepID=A0A6I6JHQ9_9BACT|nr:RHS repeat-associated core domain-containing protein [Pseudodesulfovibrio cashew]QGY39637.1 RHS repeat-associated core domain-containing protein [Pseudodesulfovibrio cashew]
MSNVYTCELKHDRNGRIVEKVETVQGKAMKWTYAYDKEGRLFEAHLGNRLVCQCHYDREGRRQQDYFPRTHGKDIRNYSYRMDNRLASAGNNRFTHDKNGFRSIWNHEGQYTTYRYAPDYRLLRAEQEDAGIVFEFTHDENGRREVKYRNGELVEAYTWLDFLRLAGFHDGEAGYRFAYDGDERTPYAMQREDGAVAYLYYDQVGSLRVVADGSGNVIKEILYDPFGGIIEDTNPGLRVPIGFAGGLHDRDLGFVRFGWRDYDTFTSRWTAPDPLGDKGGDPDWYGYCLDDPVNGVDPLGLFAWLSQLLAKGAANEAAKTYEIMKNVKWGGNGRAPISDGPMYGNWGGKNYSGGKTGGEVGDAGPIDSSDVLYKQHDLAYEKAKNTPVLGDVKKAQREMIKMADKNLVNGLNELDSDPRNWPSPPPVGTEKTASWFKDKAEWWFK